ncbi:MAG: hypothetical protein OHK93_003620 [Ramalina farinacea]|uniref:DUF7779 domain-containing protein n=1 Tax=Ramalina farinacea TaxID=258253 RepID=A0AA43TUU2_9LECA|nr:hypothetical protein [Ramalina farinacea]
MWPFVNVSLLDLCAVFRGLMLRLYLASPPPKPFSTVPFRRDPDFVDRGDLLSRVDERCSEPAGRAALVGLGGVGKSQIAIEHTHRTRERSPETWVFWVHASNAARFEHGYRDIADVVEIAGREDPQANMYKLVHDWLCRCEGKWLMVLDNVDDADYLIKRQAVIQSQSSDSGRQTPPPLRDYLPQSQNGSILITTRSQKSALEFSEQNELIQVDPMDASNAIELLDKKLESIGQRNDKDLVELAAILEFMPLAIVQAASYISQLSPRYSARQYIEEFQKSDRKKSSLLNHEGGKLRRDGEAKNSIIITWQISFEHIHQTSRPAAELLSLMSFFDPQGIPEILVRGRAGDAEHKIREGKSDNGVQSDTDSESELNDDDEFEMDVRTLRDSSFISITSDPKVFEMHRLVQLATRKWLEANEQLEKWKEQYIKILYEELPNGQYENWTYCRALFPHAKSAVTQRPKGDRSLREWASLLHNAAWYALRMGSITEAVDLSEIAMKVREKILGQEHKETLSSINMVGSVYNLGGRWDKAEELEVRVMETTKRVLGEEHPDTLTSMANLASTYWNQGRWKEAEELDVRVMETTKRVLGEEHPDTLTSMANLASIYRNQGRWKEAEELDVRVMETRKRVLGEEHPSTLTSMANLASTYRNQGRWKEAEELDVRVMETTKRVLGEEHPDTLTSMANLASTYRNQGRWKEAEELDVRVMETRKRVLGEEHPDTLTSMANLASTYWNQGRWKEAEELDVRVMETTKRVLGEEHPDTLTSMANLASTYRNQGRWKEAEELDVRVMETTKRVLGEEHPDTLTSMANLASTYWNQGRWKEAEELDVRVMETRKRVLGEEHPSTLTSIANLASTYRN